jgi:hydroxymethylglutaryl-CoA reductase (NADPH)
MFPSALLAKLYVKGSLRNIPGGFEFRIKNIIDSATLVGMGPLTVDAGSVRPEDISIFIGGNEIRADAITKEKPVTVRASVETRVVAHSAQLAAGSHGLTVQLFTADIGRVQFSVIDELAA